MATGLATSPSMDEATRPKPTREQARALGERKKAARRKRTFRIRRAIAVAAVAAFIGPFGVIYAQLASGHDPALASGKSATTSSVTTQTQATSPPSTAGTTQVQTTSPAPVTTQQS